MERETLPRLLLRNAAERSGFPAIRHKRLGIWRTWSWSEQAEEVSRLAFGLAVLGFGEGQRLAVLADNRPETYWSIGAAQMLRGVAIPLPGDLGADEVVSRLRAMPASIAIAEGQEQVDKLLAAREALPALRTIVHVESRGLRGYGNDGLASMSAVIADGERLRRTSPGLVEEGLAAATPDDTAVVLHSAAGGGVARPIELSHAELIASADSGAALFGLSAHERVLALLATSWFVDHQTSYVQSYRLGYCVHCPEGRDTILADLREVAPTFLPASPRLLEALLRIIEARMCGASRWRRRLVSWALESGSRLGRAFVLDPLLDGLGLPRLRVGVAVGRRLDRRFAARWRSLGLPLVSAFGCTEAAGFPAMMSDDGEVGDAAPGFEISFVGGELAFRRRVPGAAEAAPWRRTGDVALRRAPGQSALCRRDEIIPLKDDRELAPSVVEALLTSHREVRDALLVPDGQDGAAAVIVPDPDLLAAWATERRIPYSTPADLARNDELVAHFAGIVSQLNAELGRDGMASWSIGLFSLCFSPFESDDFGASGQPRRRLLEARHSELLARLHERREAVPDGWIEPSAVRMTTAAPTPHQPARESAA